MAGILNTTASLYSKQTTLVAAEATLCTTLTSASVAASCMSAPLAAKKPRAGSPRLTLQLTFNHEGSMPAFRERMDALKTAFAPAEPSPLKPVELMAKLFDLAEAHLASSPSLYLFFPQHLLSSYTLSLRA